MDKLKAPGKPFEISKRAVWEAWEKVRANKGAPGVDAVTVAEFESGLEPAFLRHLLPAAGARGADPEAARRGHENPGRACCRGSVAQTVVAGVIGAGAEPIFHPDSYGYQPGRSALDAVAVCRRRCWKADWVIDLDIRKFFDTMPWDLAVQAVQAVTDLPWVVL